MTLYAGAEPYVTKEGKEGKDLVCISFVTDNTVHNFFVGPEQAVVFGKLCEDVGMKMMPGGREQ